MRRAYLLLIAAAVILFVAISALLARVFSADGAERTALTALVGAEARGDTAGALDRISGCRANARCSARVERYVATLKRPGTVAILQINPSAGFSLTATVGVARVAWNVGGSLPIVQCVRVRRGGDAISGWHIELLAILKIASNADCPARL
jgi:hypothetical protein